MDTREAFLQSTVSLISGFRQLAQFMLVGNTAAISIMEVNVVERGKYEDIALDAINEIKKIPPDAFESFMQIYRESAMVLAFSWLESFLDEVEEALYLTDPSHIGDQVQIKLGKILTVGSLEELLHDVVKRRIRERSQWSLGNRLKDLRDTRGFGFDANEKDIEWLSDRRNSIIHERTLGTFQVQKRAVGYSALPTKSAADKAEVDRFLHIATNTVVDLYLGACRVLKITARFPLHKKNREFIAGWRKLWAPQAAKAKELLH